MCSRGCCLRSMEFLAGHRSGHVVEAQLAEMHPRDPKRQRVECSPQARIGRQDFQQGIGSRQPVRHPCNLVGREV